MFVLRNLSITKKTKIILLVFLLLIASAVALYAFNLLPFTKKVMETTNNANNMSSQAVNEDRSIITPNQTISDCVVLDKENCSLGRPIYENNQLAAVGFNIPEGDGVYSPFKAKYEKNAPTSLIIDGTGYSSVELMNISRDDWGTIDTRSYFSVVAYSQLPIATETLQEKESITVLSAIGKVQGDYNLILTFKEYNLKTNEWKTNIDLLKQYFPNLE